MLLKKKIFVLDKNSYVYINAGYRYLISYDFNKNNRYGPFIYINFLGDISQRGNFLNNYKIGHMIYDYKKGEYYHHKTINGGGQKAYKLNLT